MKKSVESSCCPAGTGAPPWLTRFSHLHVSALLAACGVASIKAGATGHGHRSAGGAHGLWNEARLITRYTVSGNEMKCGEAWLSHLVSWYFLANPPNAVVPFGESKVSEKLIGHMLSETRAEYICWPVRL